MSFEVLWLSMKEIDSLGITMPEVMDAVENGFAALGRDEVEMPAKIGVHPREDCFVHAMPCHVGGDIDACGVKCVSGYPRNQKKGLPYITGIFCLLDPETGIVKALMDAAWITAWRTGAASGVYARHFGDPDSETVSVVGLGVQGRVNLLAMAEVFPKLNRAQVFDVFPAQAERFIAEMQAKLPDVEFVPCKDVLPCVTGADVVVTCTPIVEAPERFIPRNWLKESVLAISVDYDSAFQADVFAENFTVDNRNQYLWTQNQGGYFQNGYPDAGGIYADMGEICSGLREGVREGLRGAVLMGIASHDIMTAALIHEKAVRQNLGIKLEL
ncbi:ornithine cyclodeaminase family protein [Paucidesulfovibrio longus]|uniref:ornithine cyclodeaminase family protein n=1 Tax=Paucidesulfovibrio longus TaxID=889 RepID=UPI0003B5740B|nr:ornithine cyclodeaminase family protein [Paucidesulfovibrio longus]